ncbi:epoxide hydrolase family protein [Amycolatopsis cynarae]|uniref:epoxide hydrolase family protein n=1 Tax=Amycolatopsis cynarae TaxID=2995223 RepID=UPI002E0EF1D1
MTEIQPFRIAVPQARLHDLKARLTATRWAPQLPGEGWRRGVPVAYLRELAEYWATGYDWRAQEARLNTFPQYTTVIDGLTLHFLHVRSANPQARPLLLTHGWPSTFAEFTEVIEPLNSSFHLVIPSIPGFGFSGAPVATGFGVAEVGRIWAALMDRLGYHRYGVQGGDLGAYIAPETAKAAPGRVTGVYVNSGLGMPTEADLPELSSEEAAFYHQMQGWADSGVDHHRLLRAAPQTFNHAWHDSPAGQLAWLIHKFGDFTFTETPDLAISRDWLLTNASLYWFTGTSGTSSWFMYDTKAFAWPPGQRVAPTGVYSGPPGIRRLAERDNDIVHWPEGRTGGHFVALESPGELAADLERFFASTGR